MDRTRIEPIADWLTAESLKGTPDPDLFRGLCQQLVDAGLPLMRANVSYRSLHPLYGGHSLTWWRAEDMETTDWERRVESIG